MERIKAVNIHYVDREHTYKVTSLAECKNLQDQEVFLQCLRNQEVVLLKEVCAEPLWGKV